MQVNSEKYLVVGFMVLGYLGLFGTLIAGSLYLQYDVIISIAIWFGGTLSSFFMLGFAKVIELLVEIKNK